MKNTLQTSANSLNENERKDNTPLNQLQTIFEYLQKHIATASMVSMATGVPQKNICRYKRDLEKAARLWETEKKLCAITGFKAWYLTTNPDKAPKYSATQLNIFSHE